MSEILTENEHVLLRSDIISSRTDNRGIITFVNPTFLKITGYSKPEVLGYPHNIIRHPGVPRALKSACPSNGPRRSIRERMTPT